MVEWKSYAAGASPPAGNRSRTHWLGDYVGPRPSLDISEKRKLLPLLGTEPPPFQLLVLHYTESAQLIKHRSKFLFYIFERMYILPMPTLSTRNFRIYFLPDINQ
jgi:hypothetical protein